MESRDGFRSKPVPGSWIRRPTHLELDYGAAICGAEGMKPRSHGFGAWDGTLPREISTPSAPAEAWSFSISETDIANVRPWVVNPLSTLNDPVKERLWSRDRMTGFNKGIIYITHWIF
jgi:hypothetical protein